MLPGLFIKTFGCQMNEYDSEKVVNLLATNYQVVSDPSQAEIVFINTCSVREKAELKLGSFLGVVNQVKKTNRRLIIGVGGCVAQQEGVNLVGKFPMIDFVVGTHNLSLIPALVKQAQNGQRRQVAVDYREEWEDLPDTFLPTASHDSEPIVRALVSIQRGCNKNCSFCVVPTTRGPEVSRDPDEVLREVRLKAHLGAREVLLLGQTVNSYGRDLNPRYSFENLLLQISKIDSVKRIRFTSPHPQEVRDGFLNLYASIPQLCPHIHLPLQSGSDRILKLMNRNYRQSRYLEIVDRLRTVCPNIAITSDIIVGFPTETEIDFEQTLEIMRKVRYNSVYSFIYSRRPDTLAQATFSAAEEIPRDLALSRLSMLQELQNDISLEINRAQLGSQMEVLVEGPSKKISSLMWGRNLHNVAVVISDGVNSANCPKAGELAWVEAIDCGPGAFSGRLVAQNFHTQCAAL